ncbi:MAG: OmpW/AlkL family protein [Alphaproteobacteria bacterium]|jgi:outer membrane protein W
MKSPAQLMVAITILLFSTIACAGDRLTEPRADEKYSELILRSRISLIYPIYDEEFFSNGGSILDPKLASKKYVQKDTSFGIDLAGSYFLSKKFALNLDQGFYTSKRTKYNFNGTEVSGKLKYFPTTLSMEYYPYIEREISPYFGVGYNYTFLSSGIKGVKFSNSNGFSAHTGLDWWFGDFALNVELRKVLMNSNVKYSGVTSSNITSDTTIDPWIFMVGISYDL